MPLYSMDTEVKGTAQTYQKVAAAALVAYTVLPSVLSYLHLVLSILFFFLFPF
jgi:hypothetical protein